MSLGYVTKFHHKCLLIAVTDDDWCHQVRHAWIMMAKKAQRYPYVMAVKNGVIKEVYQATDWRATIEKHFPACAKKDPTKYYGFLGKLASDDIRGQYIGRHVPDDYLQ